MTHIFVPEKTNAWSVLSLKGDRYRLSSQGGPGDKAKGGRRERCAPTVVSDRGGLPSRKGALLLRVNGATGGAEPLSSDWAVLAGVDARIRINGAPLAVGFAALRHRDELCLHGALPLYFSTERLVSVETYPADDSPRCPRCTLPIEKDDTYVRCPGCNVLQHQLPERKCWTYAATCTLCDQSTDMAAGYRWSPEGL